MRADYIQEQDLEIILALLMPQNRLICQLAIHTGLRIGDTVALKASQLKPRVSIRESKTGKSRRITIPTDLLARIKAQAGEVWAFPSPNKDSQTGHKTRQAVWADIKRASAAVRLNRNATPHSLRKVYAVRAFARTGDLTAVQKALNHTDPAVTMLYAMADQIAARRTGRKRFSRP